MMGLASETLETYPQFIELGRKYPYAITYYRKEAFLTTEFEVKFQHPRSGVWFARSFQVDDEAIHKFQRPEHFFEAVTVRLENTCQELTVAMGEELTGKYPFTRLWADRHITGNKVQWFCNPGKEVQGWVHNKFRGQKEYPKEGTVTVSTPSTIEFNSAEITEDGSDEITERARKTARLLGRTSKANIHGAHAEMILEGVEMATKTETNKRKVKVVKKAIDPSTIKKPNCKVHNSAMEFDPVTQKWRCTVEGCGMVARPKGDDTDREVRVGKGNIQCRLISNEGELTVVLISDDNVTLDITRFVDVAKLIDEFDAVTIADAASTNGRETFSINDAKQLPIKMSLTVMGATDLVVNNPDED